MIKKAGFSLMELIIAIAILGILAVTVGPRLMGLLGFAKDKRVNTELLNLKQAVFQYYAFSQTYPPKLIDLAKGKKALIEGMNIEGENILDPWNQPYQYRLIKGGVPHPFDLYSMGDPSDPQKIDAWTIK